MFPRSTHARVICHSLRPGFWLLVSAVAALLISTSWMRWVDPQIDFGWQVYLPWRLSIGEHLGRDYVQPYGPLSSYLNAALFRVFGAGIKTLVIANLAVYALIVVLLYRLLRVAFGFTGAALATLVGLVLFGFGNHSWVNNYTYAAPYSHEATHGMALFLVLLLLLVRAFSRPQASGWPIGLVFGLVCLTKVEIAFAAAVSIVATTLLLPRASPPARRRLAWVAQIAIAATGVIGTAWALLTLAMDASTALRVATGGILAPVYYRAIASDEVSRAILGIDNAAGNLRLLVQFGLGSLAFITGLTFLLKWTAAGAHSRARAITGAMFSLLLVLAGMFLLQQWYIRAGRTFPLLMLAAGSVLLRRVYLPRSSDKPPLRRRLFSQVLLWIAGLAIMCRVMLAPKVYHYGFYLTLLSGVWLTAFFVAEWPRLTLRRSRWQLLLGGELAALAVTGTMFYLSDSLQHYGPRTEPLGEGPDAIRGLDPKLIPAHALIESTRKFLAQTPADATVLVLPEGTMLNYWTRRKHPLKIGDTLPSTLRQYGRPIVADLEKAAPDYVVVMSRPVNEYKPFGSDSESGREMVDWLAQKYMVVATAGGDPLSASARDFGVRVFQRSRDPSIRSTSPAE